MFLSCWRLIEQAFSSPPSDGVGGAGIAQGDFTTELNLLSNPDQLFLGIRPATGQGPLAAPRTVAISAQAGVEESPDTTGQRAS